MPEQLELHFTPYRNSAFFSAHWLKNRLKLEPEWNECRGAAERFARALLDLWQVQRGRVERYESEHALEQAFIQPVLQLLGWKFKYQPHLQGRKPDYALFLTDAALDAALASDHTSLEFWAPAAAVGDAKGWDVSLDRPIMTRGQREFPPQQIEWYLDRSGLEYGILTNGRLWRVSPRLRQAHQGRFNTYYEFDLEKFLTEWFAKRGELLIEDVLVDDALYFYLLFGPVGYRATDERKPLIVRAIEGSSTYRVGVGEDLRRRAFEAVRLATDGFLSFATNGLNADEHLALCQRESFILIYRLLFIMFAEDRGLLPYATNRQYRENRSLRRHRDDVAARLDQVSSLREADFPKTTHAICDDLRDLFDLVDAGKRSYGVHAYNGGLFDREAHPFLQEKQISDWHLARIIDQLGRASDPDLDDAGLFRVDYRDLAIQHLGSIYEGLLELQPRRATVTMKVVAKRGRERVEEQVIPESHPDPDGFEDTEERLPAGYVYLQTNKGERRASGSYYTPDHIVNHVVQHTLGPLCRRVSEELGREVEKAEREADGGDEAARERLAKLVGEFDDRLLKLRVLDPAMGSGHFLLRACSFLAEEIATHPLTAEAGADESSLTYWKRRVSESCLFGVDLNDMAVELAKLAMWLETVAVDRPLTFLDHHFRNGNSLVGARIAALGALPDATGLLSEPFVRAVEEKIPLLLEPLAEIERTPSTETAQVKQKERLLKRLESVREPFRDVADVWCSTLALPEEARVHGEDYRRLIDEIGRPRRFAEVLAEDGFVRARESARRAYGRCLHWELEFPEAFFDGGGRRERAGFDAIIGNPPYDVLSELETGRDLTAFRAFLSADAVYAPSMRGKNNLYKLFVCRALELLAEGGYFGFITPMAVLGDDQAADLRRALLAAGTFTAIDAFPQKDDPRRRVFPEAKLSTAVFVLQKCDAERADAIEFTSRVQPGRELKDDSPSLRMRRRDIRCTTRATTR
jgi:type I restriction-modification system DNA methylase subunit